MVAVPREKIVSGPEELFGRFVKYGIDFFFGCECKAVEDLTSESATRRVGLGLRPVHAGQARAIMATVGIFPAVDDDSGVQE